VNSNENQYCDDTITAIATASGKAGVAIIRISGPQALALGNKIVGRQLPVREAVFAYFKDNQQQVIDSGLVIYFAGPNSFTGEDVVELHGHGSPIIQDLLIKQLIQYGARQARAGEFTERAFLNDKIDLAQAEAIADLIDSTTAQAAKGAMRSLQGEFSDKVNILLKELVELRVYVEAAIDFPEEEIDFLADDKLLNRVKTVQEALKETLHQASQGAILRNGLRLVLAGKPNAGKSSLLNALSGKDAAIVTDIPGTTRDTVSQTIDIDGLPVQLIDTAGLRDSVDKVEQIGISRARKAIEEADHVLLVVDARQTDFNAPDDAKTTVLFNKIDLVNQVPEIAGLAISATRGDGIEALKRHIKMLAGYESNSETIYSARRRHLTALEGAQQAVKQGLHQLKTAQAGELLADELLQAQNYLNEITGEFDADDLLGEIFAGFCIGK